MPARVGGVEVEIPGVTLGGLDDTQEARVYVFQYLIGNTDWSLVTALEEEDCCHNGKLVDRDGSLLVVDTGGRSGRSMVGVCGGQSE